NIGDKMAVRSLVPQVIPAAWDVEAEIPLHVLPALGADQRHLVTGVVPAVLLRVEIGVGHALGFRLHGASRLSVRRCRPRQAMQATSGYQGGDRQANRPV